MKISSSALFGILTGYTKGLYVLLVALLKPNSNSGLMISSTSRTVQVTVPIFWRDHAICKNVRNSLFTMPGVPIFTCESSHR